MKIHISLVTFWSSFGSGHLYFSISPPPNHSLTHPTTPLLPFPLQVRFHNTRLGNTRKRKILQLAYVENLGTCSQQENILAMRCPRNYMLKHNLLFSPSVFVSSPSSDSIYYVSPNPTFFWQLFSLVRTPPFSCNHSFPAHLYLLWSLIRYVLRFRLFFYLALLLFLAPKVSVSTCTRKWLIFTLDLPRLPTSPWWCRLSCIHSSADWFGWCCC